MKLFDHSKRAFRCHVSSWTLFLDQRVLSSSEGDALAKTLEKLVTMIGSGISARAIREK